MSATPLCDALRSFAAQHPLRMHMPGHKGRVLPLMEASSLSPLDVTELPPTGDLFAGGGAIGEAEALWAETFHMARCLFLTGGSTQGMLAALTMSCSPGSRILLDRNCHRSVYNALALLDLKPVYLNRPWLLEEGLCGPVVPAEADHLLSLFPDIKTICITSPTYYGILSDIPALSAAAHRHSATLIVDGAHGAHLPFLDDFSLSAADILVISAHKTLPALGQSALLLAGPQYPQRELRRAASLYGSSSPSYPIMASLDAARAFLEREGGQRYQKTAVSVSALRDRFPTLRENCNPLDPCRLVVHTADGLALQASLEQRGIYPEMADRGHVVFICTCADTDADFTRLAEALTELMPADPQPTACIQCPPSPQAVLTPREALFAPREYLPLRECTGRISAQQIAPYPPGIPVVAPGELVEKKTVAYFEGIGYNMLEDIEVVRAGACVLPGTALPR